MEFIHGSKMDVYIPKLPTGVLSVSKLTLSCQHRITAQGPTNHKVRSCHYEALSFVKVHHPDVTGLGAMIEARRHTQACSFIDP